jgi:hypothetical protein
MATASGVLGPKQSKGYFVTLASLVSSVQYNAPVVAGAGGSFSVGPLTSQSASAPSGVADIPTGQYLKDMGKTVVSSNRTFRKVQRVVAATNLTTSAAALGAPFYIELPTSSNVNPVGTQVAYLPGLM